MKWYYLYNCIRYKQITCHNYFFYNKIYTGCPNEYIAYNGHCYGFVGQKLDWPEARHQCIQIGSEFDLVVINDDEENRFIKDQIENKFNGEEYWIGLEENDDKDGFEWIDGSDLSFTDFASDGQDEVISV